MKSLDDYRWMVKYLGSVSKEWTIRDWLQFAGELRVMTSRSGIWANKGFAVRAKGYTQRHVRQIQRRSSITA